MTYKYFGQTGMKVSKLSYGTWINKTLTDKEGQKLISECVKACYDRGINLCLALDIFDFTRDESRQSFRLRPRQRQDHT